MSEPDVLLRVSRWAPSQEARGRLEAPPTEVCANTTAAPGEFPPADQTQGSRCWRWEESEVELGSVWPT